MRFLVRRHERLVVHSQVVRIAVGSRRVSGLRLARMWTHSIREASLPQRDDSSGKSYIREQSVWQVCPAFQQDFPRWRPQCKGFN